VRRPTASASAVARPVFAATVCPAWRRLTAAPKGDVIGLVATALGTFGLVLLAVWLHERGRRPALMASTPRDTAAWPNRRQPQP